MTSDAQGTARRAISAQHRRSRGRRILRTVLFALACLVLLLAAAAAAAGAGLWWFRHDGTAAKLGHDGRIYVRGYVGTVLFAPNGRRLVACGSGGPDTWELPSQAPRPLLGTGRIGKRLLDAEQLCAISPDGKLLAAAVNPWWPEATSPGTLQLWGPDWAARPRLLDENDRHTDALAFAPTGDLLAVTRNAYSEAHGALYDGQVLVFDIASGAIVDRIAHPGRALRSALYLPNGDLLFVQRWREPMPAFPVETSALVLRSRVDGSERELLRSREPLVRSVRTDARGARLLVTFEDSPLARVVDRDGRLLTEVVTGEPLQPNFGGGALSPDGELLAFPTSPVTGQRPFTRWARAVGLWDVKTGNLRRVLAVRSSIEGFAVHALAFSPDGRTLAAGLGSPFTGQVALWPITEAAR